MKGWSTSDYISLMAMLAGVTGLCINLVTALATVSLVPNRTQRVLYRTSLHTVFFSFIAIFVGATHFWITGSIPFTAQSAAPTTNSNQESPIPTPSPALQSTPKPLSESGNSNLSTPTQSHSTPFSIYTKDDHALRAYQCLVGDFDGEYRRDGDSLIVNLTNTKLEMCRQSSDYAREIESLRVGIGDYDEVINDNEAGVMWSETVNVNKKIIGGGSMVIAPQNLSIQGQWTRGNHRKALIVELTVVQRGCESVYTFIG